MIRRRLDEANAGVLVDFVAPDFLDAAVACVVGDFNGWDPYATPFRRRGGERIATAHLPAGIYRFRYLTGDRRWFDEPEADGQVPNTFGGTDNLIEILAGTLGADRPHAPADTPPHATDIAGDLSILTQTPAAVLHIRTDTAHISDQPETAHPSTGSPPS